jgi:hypothetical protein
MKRRCGAGGAMEIDYLSLPEVTMVELPCFCQNTKTVEAMMNGKEIFEQTIREENQQMKFSWDPTDPHRPPVIGKRNQKQGILVSLKKLKSGVVITKPLGRVTNSYSFRSPPSYQVTLLPPSL